MALIGRGQITIHIAEQGEPGKPGTPGTSSFLHIRYSTNANGNPMTTTPNTYIGIAVTTSATAPTSYADYAWSRLTVQRAAMVYPARRPISISAIRPTPMATR